MCRPSCVTGTARSLYDSHTRICGLERHAAAQWHCMVEVDVSEALVSPGKYAWKATRPSSTIEKGRRAETQALRTLVATSLTWSYSDTRAHHG